jgi:hypothetical protein
MRPNPNHAVAGRTLLPLRPSTAGELLDCGVTLLRRSARVALPVAFSLAVLEQAALYLLGRPVLGVGDNPFVWVIRMFRDHWTLLALGFGTELMIVALLGGIGARAALPALFGPGVTDPRRFRFAPEVGAAALIGLFAAVSAFFIMAPVVIVIMTYGLCLPALVVERLSAREALRIGSRLAWSGGRARGIRLVAYLMWWLIRQAIGIAALAGLARLLPPLPSLWLDVIGALVWAVANAVGYGVLGCVDAALYLETRYRLQGMDIALSRAIRRREPVEAILVRPQ